MYNIRRDLRESRSPMLLGLRARKKKAPFRRVFRPAYIRGYFLRVARLWSRCFHLPAGFTMSSEKKTIGFCCCCCCPADIFGILRILGVALLRKTIVNRTEYYE